MSKFAKLETRALPPNANLQYLKKEAKDRLANMRQQIPSSRLSEAQYQIASEYGFASWRSLKTAVEGHFPIFDSPDELAHRRAEQALPRKAIPFDPKRFDAFTGFYQLDESVVFTVSRVGNSFYLQATSQVPVEIFPETKTKFFFKVVPAQVSFIVADGKLANTLVLHQRGHEQRATRIDPEQAEEFEKKLAQRIAQNLPSSATEDLLRHHIARLWEGRPDYGAMTPALAAGVHEQLPVIRAYAKRWGSLKSLAFKNVTVGGIDAYEVIFDGAKTKWLISPISAQGLISALVMTEEP